jgi:hypothetical protein
MRDALPMAEMELSFICSWVFFRVTPKDRGSAPPRLKSLLSTVLTTTPHDSLGHVHHRAHWSSSAGDVRGPAGSRTTDKGRAGTSPQPSGTRFDTCGWSATGRLTPAQRPRTRPACQGRMGVRIVVEKPGGRPGIGPVLRLRCALVSVSGAARAAGYQVRPCFWLSLWCRCP